MVIDPFRLAQANQSIQSNRAQLANMGVQKKIAQQRLSDMQEQAKMNRTKNVMQFGANTYNQIQQNPEQADVLYRSAKNLASRQGYDVSTLPEQYDEQAEMILSNMHSQVYSPENSKASSSLQEFNQLSSGLSEEDRLRAQRIKLGLDPRAVTNAAGTAALTGTVEDLAGAEGQIAGAKEKSKLEQKLNLEPQVARAVEQAKADVKEIGQVRKEDRSNAAALDVYQTAMTNLAQSMGQATTGPFMSWLPGLTSNQQIARGATAMMAPVLKQMFRSAGEGTFTDKDQELLLKMVPTVDDLPEARSAKIAGINAIVMSKLGGGENLDRVKQQQGVGGNAPAPALEYLKNNPQMIDAFEQKYGYRPEGF